MTAAETPANYFAHALETATTFFDVYEGDVGYTLTCLLTNDADAGMPRSDDFESLVWEAYSEHRYVTDARLPEAVEKVRRSATDSEGAFEEAVWWAIREMDFEHESDPGLVNAKAIALGPKTTTAEDDYMDDVKGSDLWWDNRSYTDYQIGGFDD